VPVFNVVRRGAYHDSVTLMRLSREMESVPGVTRAAAMMGTPQNRALLRDAGLLSADGEVAAPTDLIIAVIAEREADARTAAQAAEAALARPVGRSGAGDRVGRPRTLRGALAGSGQSDLALISVPGPYAAAEATKALHAGLHVMLFSDNVTVEDEVGLKRLARERGLFMMGPDCGTAIIGGVPLGFANAVPRGRIGLAAASGTGLQAVTCHLAASGEGVSHAIGLGGRDFSDEVGGLMLERALEALAADAGTEVIVVLGKAPGPGTAKTIRGWLERLGKPWIAHFAGDGADPATLEDTAVAAAALARGDRYRPVEFTLTPETIAQHVQDATHRLEPERRHARGVYAGGTLAQEAATLLRATLGDVGTGATARGHRVVDLGDDIYTVGRPHPMIDGAVRREWIAREAADASVAVILLDVVLGYGAHPDPAGELASAIAAGRTSVAVVASVCGTDHDPQGRSRQEATLRNAGAVVMPSNAQAARLAARIAAARAR
jgi:FdrA protein